MQRCRLTQREREPGMTWARLPGWIRHSQRRWWIRGPECCWQLPLPRGGLWRCAGVRSSRHKLAWGRPSQSQFLNSYAEDVPLSLYVEVSSLDDGFSSSLDTFDPVPDTRSWATLSPRPCHPSVSSSPVPMTWGTLTSRPRVSRLWRPPLTRAWWLTWPVRTTLTWPLCTVWGWAGHLTGRI